MPNVNIELTALLCLFAFSRNASIAKKLQQSLQNLLQSALSVLSEHKLIGTAIITYLFLSLSLLIAYAAAAGLLFSRCLCPLESHSLSRQSLPLPPYPAWFQVLTLPLVHLRDLLLSGQAQLLDLVAGSNNKKSAHLLCHCLLSLLPHDSPYYIRVRVLYCFYLRTTNAVTVTHLALIAGP